MYSSTNRKASDIKNQDVFHQIVIAACSDKDWLVTSSRYWISVTNRNVQWLSQGWKLHITGAARNGLAILNRVLPLLILEMVHFKTVASMPDLCHLNQGQYGETQVGKFITVYPSTDEQAVRLAEKLDQLTHEFEGPRVPSDRQLRRGSLIYYRYGAFTSCYMQTRLGEIVPVIRKPDGTLERDERRTNYSSYPWVVDPFIAAGLSTSEPITLMVGGRYLIVEVKGHSIRNTVFTAIDTLTGEPCILKQAHYSVGLHSSSDPVERVRHEADILRVLSKDLSIPRVRDVIQDKDIPVLVMDYCDGETLEEYISAIATQGRFLRSKELVSWGLKLINLIGKIHDKGIAYGDLKPPNIIVNLEDETIHLVDFEGARWIDAGAILETMATPGFASPNRSSSGKLCIADDIYAFGAVLYFMATGADPSHAPNPRCLLERPPEVINPLLSSDIIRLIEACLEPEVMRRPPSTAAVHDALQCASIQN